MIETAYTLEGETGTHRGRSAGRYPHTIAADALCAATGTPWQTVDYRKLKRTAAGAVWAIEGRNAGKRSGSYRLTIKHA